MPPLPPWFRHHCPSASSSTKTFSIILGIVATEEGAKLVGKMIDNKILKLAMERRVKNQAKEEELKDLKELQTQEPKPRESQPQEPQQTVSFD